MIKLFPIVLALLFFGCKDVSREEIIDRYPSGEKKLLVKYRGQGVDEIITEKIYYDKLGNILIYEYPIEQKKVSNEYHSNNMLKSSKSYLMDKLEGIKIIYDKEGNLIRELNYKNGLRSGLETYYYSDGKTWIVNNYEVGKLVSTLKYDKEGNQIEDLSIKKVITKIFDDDNTLTSTQISEFTIFDKISKYYLFDAKGNYQVGYMKNYNYDSLNRLIQIDRLDENGQKYKKDSKWDNWCTQKLEYNDNDDDIKFERTLNSSAKEIEVKEYFYEDITNELIKEISHSVFPDSISYTTEYFYENNLLTKTTENFMNSIYDNIYEYDEEGNIKREIYLNNGENYSNYGGYDGWKSEYSLPYETQYFYNEDDLCVRKIEFHNIEVYKRYPLDNTFREEIHEIKYKYNSLNQIVETKQYINGKLYEKVVQDFNNDVEPDKLTKSCSTKDGISKCSVYTYEYEFYE